MTTNKVSWQCKQSSVLFVIGVIAVSYEPKYEEFN